MLGDHCQDLLPEDLDERRSTNHGALMREQDGETVPRRRSGPGWLRTARTLGWSSAAALKEVKQVHAALLNSVSKKLFLSLGTLMASVSPLRRRAASR